MTETKVKKEPKKMEGFRIEPELHPTLLKIAEKADRPKSWVINQCLKRALPILEKEVA
jgi:predicted transcriptional regulator